MSHISDLLSKIKQADQKKGVPPGLTAAIGSSKRRSSGRRRAVLLASSVAFAIALGIFTLYVAVSLKDKQGLPPAPAGQPALTPGAAVKDKPESLVVKPGSASSVSQKKINTPSAQAALKAASVIEEKAPAAADAGSSAYEPHAGVETPAKDAYKPSEDEALGSIADKVAHELYLASNYERVGDDASAIASYRKALQLEPGNYKAMNNIASILLKAGSIAEAVPYLKDALRARVSYVPALVNMGIALARGGAADEAETHFSKALSIEPANEAALLNMAVLYENSGRKELAREYYGRLRSLGYPQGAPGLNRLR